MSGGGAIFIGLVIVAAAIVVLSTRIVGAIDASRREATLRQLQSMFAPGIQAVQDDPRQFLMWYPLAQASRRLFADAFGALDAASGSPFPFSRNQIQEALQSPIDPMSGAKADRV